jgi:hypothetical protein
MNPCDHCKIRTGCDWLSEMCRMTPRQVAKRLDLIANPPEPVIEKIIREPKVRKKVQVAYEKRKDYHRQRYQKDREKLLAYAKQRQRERSLANYHANKLPPRAERRAATIMQLEAK